MESETTGSQRTIQALAHELTGKLHTITDLMGIHGPWDETVKLPQVRAEGPTLASEKQELRRQLDRLRAELERANQFATGLLEGVEQLLRQVG